MGVELFGCVCGQLHAPNAGMAAGGEGVGRFPLPFYVIEHPKGRVMFDCGVHADLAHPTDPIRSALESQGLKVVLEAGEDVTSRLAALDIAPSSIRYVVLSHLHFDHVGGLHQVPDAEIVVQRREWEAGMDPDRAARNFLNRPYFDLGHKVKLVDGDHDLFGDGRLTLLATYGHTPGHQSLRVRTDGADHILTADACYFCSVVTSRAFPAFSDAKAMDASLDRLLALGDAATTYVFGHDQDQWGADPVVQTRRGGASAAG